MSALRSSPIIPGMDFPPINREVFLISKNGRCHLYQRCLQLFLQIGTCPPITSNTAQVQGQRIKVLLSSMKSQGDMILSFCSQMRLQTPTRHINLLLPERNETAVGHTEREPGSSVHSVRPATLGTHTDTLSCQDWWVRQPHARLYWSGKSLFKKQQAMNVQPSRKF